jgi:hypothetical protein
MMKRHIYYCEEFPNPLTGSFTFRMQSKSRKKKNRNLLPSFSALTSISCDLTILIRRPLPHLSILGDSISDTRFPIFNSNLSQISLRYSLHHSLEQFSFAIHLNAWHQLIRRESQRSHEIEFSQSLDTINYGSPSVTAI